MKALTKAQTEAIVTEVQERLKNLQGPDILPRRAETEWKTLKEKIDKVMAMDKEISDLDEKIDELRDKRNDFKNELLNKIHTFEKRHGVDVDWEYLDEDEEPSVKVPVKDYKEKIARQIAILSIDKTGPLTAEDLIESIIKKIS